MNEVLRVLGVFQWAAAGIFAFLAFRMPRTVGYGSDEVVNIGLLHDQSIWFFVSGILFINGSLWVVGATLIEQIEKQTNRILRKEEPAPEPEIYA